MLENDQDPKGRTAAFWKEECASLGNWASGIFLYSRGEGTLFCFDFCQWQWCITFFCPEKVLCHKITLRMIARGQIEAFRNGCKCRDQLEFLLHHFLSLPVILALLLGIVLALDSASSRLAPAPHPAAPPQQGVNHQPCYFRATSSSSVRGLSQFSRKRNCQEKDSACSSSSLLHHSKACVTSWVRRACEWGPIRWFGLICSGQG